MNSPLLSPRATTVSPTVQQSVPLTPMMPTEFGQGHAQFPDKTGRYDATRFSLFRIWGPFWLLTMIVVGVIVGGVSELQYRRTKMLLKMQTESVKTEMTSKMDEKIVEIQTANQKSREDLGKEIKQFEGGFAVLRNDLAKIHAQMDEMKAHAALLAAKPVVAQAAVVGAKRTIASVRSVRKRPAVKRR